MQLKVGWVPHGILIPFIQELRCQEFKFQRDRVICEGMRLPTDEVEPEARRVTRRLTHGLAQP